MEKSINKVFVNAVDEPSSVPQHKANFCPSERSVSVRKHKWCSHLKHPSVTTGFWLQYCPVHTGFKRIVPVSAFMAVQCTEVCSMWRIKYLCSASKLAFNIKVLFTQKVECSLQILGGHYRLIWHGLKSRNYFKKSGLSNSNGGFKTPSHEILTSTWRDALFYQPPPRLNKESSCFRRSFHSE